MAKKSQRRITRHDKAQTGCIWAFISIFNFRNGRSTRTFLSDRRNSRRYVSGDFKTKQTMSRELQLSQKSKDNDVKNVRVVELMENEMFINTNGRSIKRNHKRWSSYGSKSDIEVLECLATGQSRGLDLESIINDLCRQIHQERVVRLKHDKNINDDDDLDNTESDLDEAIEMFVIQELKNEKDVTVEGRKDVVRALQSNKDAIMKHLKEHETSSNQNSRKFFRRSQSLKEIMLKEDYGYSSTDRIVILKSGIPEESNYNLEKKQTVTTHFSFTEIKRRLMNAMTKDRSEEQTDLPSAKTSVWNSPTKNRDYNEKYVVPSWGNRKKDKIESISDIYTEARKHLSEIIHGNECEIDDCSSNRRSPRSLARILSLPEFNFSPMVSPRTDTRYVFDAMEKNPQVLDEICEKTQVLDEIEQKNDDDDDFEIVIATDVQVGSMKLDDDLEEEDELLSSPTSPLIKHNSERSERPSPVSVLEPIFEQEDEFSPLSIKSNHVQPQFKDQELCIGTNPEDEESAFEFVEALLLSSDLKWDDFLHRWISSNSVLDPLLIHEVEAFSNKSLHDQKLLLDSTNEALEQVCRRYFSYSNHNILPVPKGQDLIQEIWEGVESNLVQPSPFLLENIVKRDLTDNWFDLRVDIEDVCYEICDDVLKHLLEEII